MAMDLSMGHTASSCQPGAEPCTPDSSPTPEDQCVVVDNYPVRFDKFEKYSLNNCRTDGLSPQSRSQCSPNICEVDRVEKSVTHHEQENNNNTSGTSKQFSIDDILKPDFGRLQKRQPQSASIHSEQKSTNLLNTMQYLSSQNGTSHVGNVGYLPNRLSFGDRLRPRNLVRPSAFFHEAESHRQLQCFRNNLLMAAQNNDFQRVHYRTDENTSRNSVFRRAQDPDASIPKRLQELVQRDPKRQPCYFESPERGGQVCTSGRLPDLSPDFEGRFPLDMASGGSRHMDVQDGDLGDLDSGFGTEDQEEDKSWPAWVYCTRYSDRPSAGPRARKMKRTKMNNESFILDSKRPRTAFTDTQLVRLREEFRKNHYLTEDRRKGLAWELGLGETQVKIWFQNKRAKIKKTNDYKTTLADELRAHGLYNHSVS